MTTPAILPVYRRAEIMMVRGEGCFLYDASGKEYLDFATGIAVNALGHGHPHIVNALKQQAETLWHCSNLYRNPELEKLAPRLVNATFADSVFFCSSGTEAVEAAVKFTRRFQYTNQHPERFRMITFKGGFHGRSMTGISAGGNERAREGFKPLLDGFDRAEMNDIASVKALISEHSAGIMLEAIQGEGGVVVAENAFMQELRALCDAHGMLLIFDEVQCGMCRSGNMFAYEASGIVPDIVTIAKGIGNGFPLAACLVNERVAAVMTPGSHGSTYGANPLAMAVGNAVLDVMLQPNFLDHVNHISGKLKASLEVLAARFPTIIADVRGRGLMLGIALQNTSPIDHYKLAEKLRNNGLLTAPAVEGNVIRILPPLIIEQIHVDKALNILNHTLETL